MTIGEQRQFRKAWIFAPNLTVHRQLQAIRGWPTGSTCFENLDGSNFTGQLPVDEDAIVLDYPDLFRRVIDNG